MELYINDILVDLDKSIPFPLTYQISDIRNIDQRKGSSSKTIELVGTRKNCEMMASVFTLSTTSSDTDLIDFDPSVKASARYYENGILQFKGICQLTECVKSSGTWMFSVVLFADQVDIYTLLRNYKIKELGWDEYNHSFTYANQFNSWIGVIQKNGSPYNNFTGVNWHGEGYYYGLIDYGFDRPQPNSFKVDDIPLQVYVKNIVDKMFSKIDVEYDSAFFDTQQFKRLLLAYEGGVLPEIDSASATASSVETDQLNTVGSFILDTVIGMSESSSVSDLFEPTFGYFLNNYSSNSGTTIDPSSQVQNETPMQFVSSVEGDFTMSYSGDHDVNVDFILTNGSGSSVSNVKIKAYLNIKKNGVAYQTVEVWNNTIVNSALLNHSFTASFTTDIDINLNISDVLEFSVSFVYWGSSLSDSTATNVKIETDITATNCQLDLLYNTQTLQPGSTINIKQFLPDMDCATFLKGLVTMFNLYIRPNVTNGRKLEIEPLNTFYKGSNNAIQWSDKVDYSQPFKVTPTVNFASKEYIFKFKDDADYWNDRYFNDVVEQYGSKRVLSPSQFSTGATKFELPFANKLLGEIPTTNLIVPRNFQVKTSESGSSEIVERRGKPFIVQIKKGNKGTMQLGDWNHIDEFDVSHAKTSYPYVGHLDDIDNPTFDLTFNIPSYVFYDVPTGVNYTTNNLYQFHEKFIREIVDRNGKMLTCFIKLNASDINTLDFGELINIDGVVYRLQKINDYNSSDGASTQCELIRLISGDSIQTYTIDIPTDTYQPISVRSLREYEDNVLRLTEDDNNRIIQ